MANPTRPTSPAEPPALTEIDNLATFCRLQIERAEREDQGQEAARWDEMLRQVEDLRQTVAEAEADRERLDWLERRGTRLRRASIGNPWRCIQADGRFIDEEIASDRFATAREAIDAARESSR